MGKPLRVLLVEDSPDDALLIAQHLRKGGFEVVVRRVDDSASLAQALAESQWDVILCDHNLPGFNSTHALGLAKTHCPDTPFIIVSGSIGEDVAVEAMKAGAQDYLMKSNLTRLVPAVERELAEAVDRRQRLHAEKALLAQDEEFRIGREIQQHLFPPISPNLPGFDIAGASNPATATGGDYFDYIPMPDGSCGVVIGDVSGHGVGPAVLMADARACLRTLTRTCTDIRDILSHANELLLQDFGADRFVSLIYAKLSPRAGGIVYLNAGHPEAYVVDAGGNLKATLPPALPALGFMPIPDLPVPVSLTLGSGDVVLLLTDGVTEAASPEGVEFGRERAIKVVQAHRAAPAAKILAELFSAVHAFAHGRPQQDDITAIVVKFDPS